VISEDEVRTMLTWLRYEEHEPNVPEPTQWPPAGYIFDRNQAIEMCRWILQE